MIGARMGVVAALVAVGMTIAVGGCTAGKSVDPTALEGAEWELQSATPANGDLVAAGITIKFDGSRVSGFSGVNQYGGPYTAESDGSLEIGTLSSTLMAGPEDLMAAEKEYLDLLEACDTFAFKDDGSLVLSSSKGDESLVFSAAKAVSLPGSSWVVTGYNNGKQAVVSPAVDTTLTIDFGTDGTVSGSGGVNTYSGTFTSTEGTLEIDDQLATTMMAGTEEQMAQEQAFLTALGNSATWSVSRGVLETRDATGAIQVTAVEP